MPFSIQFQLANEGRARLIYWAMFRYEWQNFVPRFNAKLGLQLIQLYNLHANEYDEQLKVKKKDYPIRM